MEYHFEVLPVTPPKLVKRILKEEYVDMAELLNNNVKLEHYQLLFKMRYLHVCTSQQRLGQRGVPDILSWLHCFTSYAAVI